MKNLIISLKAHTTKLLLLAGVLALTGCTQAALDKLTSAASDAISTSLSAASNTNSYVTVSAQSVQAGSSVTAVLHAYSAANVPMHIGGLNVSFKQSGGTSTGVFSPVVDNNDGTYSTVFTASQAGTATNIVGSIANAPLLSAAPSVLVTNASASQLAFSVQPGNGVAGSALSQQPVVEIRDSFGNRVVSGPDASAMISLSLSTGSGSLNASMQAVNGVASFSGLGINLVGSNKVITASKAATSASGAMSIGSNAFAIVNGPAAKLAFSTQPGNASAGSVFGIQPVVQMQDAFGNPVVSGADAAAMINMSVDNGVLSGSLSQVGVLGQYVFSNLKIDSAGNKILTATKPATSDSGILSVASNSFNNAVVLPPIPASPIGLNISSGNASIALSFSGSAGATSYNILRGTSAGSLAQIANIAGSPYNDAAVVNGTNYFYAVQAVNAGGASANSAVVQAMPLALPVISSISVNGAGGLNISASSAVGASSYAVKYSTVSGSASAGSSAACSVSGAVVSCPVSGLSGGTKYYFSVNAANATGSVNSLESSATAVGALSISSITPSTNSASVAFSASAGAASYDLLYGSASGVYSSTLTNIVSPVNVTGLNSGSTYFFKVRANNANGNILSNEMSSSTSLPVANSLSSSSDNNHVRLSFSAVSGATSYNILRGADASSLTQIANISGTSYDDWSAKNAVLYYYAVQAVSAAGNGANSNIVQGMPIQSTLIGAPIANGSGSLLITGGLVPSASSYIVKYSTTSGGAAKSANSTNCTYDSSKVSCVVNGLTNGTTYYFSVFANNIYNGSQISWPWEVSGSPTGSNLGAFSISAVTPTGTSAKVEFGTSTGASSYDILYGKSSGMSGGNYDTTVLGKSTGDSISGLTAGSTYYFRVRANDASGGSVLSSNEMSASIPAAVVVAPALAFVSTPAANSTLTTDSISFKDANSVVAKFQCSLDSAAYTNCTSPVAINAAVGAHTFGVHGLDASGAQIASLSYSWNISSGAASTKMRIGVNFWNKGWEPDTDYFDAAYGKNSSAWATATWSKLPSGIDAMNFNPWQAQLLKDLSAVNGTIRFMDFDNANSNPIVNWADRTQPTDPQVGSFGKNIPIADFLRSKNYPNFAYYNNEPGMANRSNLAYEWMIDLCNRTGRDMWINVPAFANDEYVTNLAKLIKAHLDPKLKVFVEYSNETWNYISAANGYSYSASANGDAYSALSGQTGPLPGGNVWYMGASWSILQSLRVFNDFVAVYGQDNTGYNKTLVRVLAWSGNSDLLKQALYSVVFNGRGTKVLNPKWNALYKQVPDAIAMAPYIGPNDDAANYQYNLVHGTGMNPVPVLDGNQADIAARFHANIDYTMSRYVPNFKDLATEFGVPLLTYEGGVQMYTNAGAWESNPAIKAEYMYFADQLAANGVQLFNHYTLYGGDWGLAKGPTPNPETVFPRFSAIKDWMHKNWGAPF